MRVQAAFRCFSNLLDWQNTRWLNHTALTFLLTVTSLENTIIVLIIIIVTIGKNELNEGVYMLEVTVWLVA
jgi:hypothetical protein